MSIFTPDQDVLSGRKPWVGSPIPGLSNASYIVNRRYMERDDITFPKPSDTKKGGFKSFAKFIDQFVDNPKKNQLKNVSDTAAIFSQQSGGVT